MVDRMNRRGLFNGRIVVMPATATSRTADTIDQQDGWYTVLSRGLAGGQRSEHVELIGSVSRTFNPHVSGADPQAIASHADLRFVVCNTTEAGVVYKPAERPEVHYPTTFPAQLAFLLHARYRFFNGAADRGWIVLPCELIDRNGDTLKRIVLQHAEDWAFDKAFVEWVHSACCFANTLVDRIVPGFPINEIDALHERLGYEDQLLTAAELYHSWVIEADRDITKEWPLTEAGLNVTWTDDLTPYRTRKVRLLNGPHTLMIAPSLLAGKETVRESLDDPLLGEMVRRALFDEIVPVVELPDADKKAFSTDVLERFRNPFIVHRLTSIALNGVSKWKVRVLPSLEAYLAERHELPPVMTFSLAALIALYRGEPAADGALLVRVGACGLTIRDEADVLTFLARAWSEYNQVHDLGGVGRTVLGSTRLWGSDLNELPGLSDRVVEHLDEIIRLGMRAALERVLSEAKSQNVKKSKRQQ
jgi:tagaturonate reductase